MVDAWNALVNFFESIWAIIELIVWTLVESLSAALEFIFLPIRLVTFLPDVVAVGVMIASAIMVIKFIGGRS